MIRTGYEDEYPDGQRMFVMGMVGTVLKLAELWGRGRPDTACVARPLGYP